MMNYLTSERSFFAFSSLKKKLKYQKLFKSAKICQLKNHMMTLTASRQFQFPIVNREHPVFTTKHLKICITKYFKGTHSKDEIHR